MPAPTKVQLIGGHFQDAEGNVLNGGHLVMELVQDEQLSSSTGQVCGGIKVSILLDSAGSVSTSPAQSVWPTDVMSPVGAYYTVWGYTAQGELAWGPNYNLLVPSGATFDVDNWLPNSTGGGSGSGGSNLIIQTNGVNNGDQALLNLAAGSNVTLTDNGVGTVTIAASGGSAGNGPRNKAIHAWANDAVAALSPTQGSGCSPAISGATFSVIGPSATDTTYLGLATASGANTLIMWVDNVPTTPDMTFTLGILGLIEKRIILPSIANIRVWVGMDFGSNNGSSANFWRSDAPPLTTVAFRYSTAAGDTNWQCVVTDGTTQHIADSGIPADVAGHTFQIKFTAPNVLFLIDGVQVASVTITGTTLSTSTTLTGFLTVDNVGLANVKSVGLDYLYWDTVPA